MSESEDQQFPLKQNIDDNSNKMFQIDKQNQQNIVQDSFKQHENDQSLSSEQIIPQIQKDQQDQQEQQDQQDSQDQKQQQDQQEKIHQRDEQNNDIDKFQDEKKKEEEDTQKKQLDMIEDHKQKQQSKDQFTQQIQQNELKKDETNQLIQTLKYMIPSQKCKYEKHELQCGGTSFTIYKHYELLRIVGSGAYGIVASGKNLLTNTNVAIKKIPHLFRDLIDARRVLREIKLLNFFKHTNIIKLIDIVLPDDAYNYKEIYLVFELMQTDLQRVIQSNLVLTDKQINWFMFQILLGVQHLHSANVIHRDLKPNNLLVNKNCDLKIGDLNLARKVDQTNFITDYVVTRWYRAPEVILSQSEYSKAIDLWSTGCILAELLGRTILFQGQNPVEQIEKIVAVLGTPKDEDLPYNIEQRTQNYLSQLPRREPVEWKDIFIYANPLAVDLLSKLLVYNPEKRLTAEQALQHPYFDEVSKKIQFRSCEENFDWSFDCIEQTKSNLMHMIYQVASQFQ